MSLVEFPTPSSRRPAPPAAPPEPPPGQGPRRAGVAILAIGIVAAIVVYWVGAHRSEPDIEDLLPNYSAANSRQMGLLYGHSGELMWEAMEEVKHPDVQALLIVITAAIVAGICFRVAWLDEQRANES